MARATRSWRRWAIRSRANWPGSRPELREAVDHLEDRGRVAGGQGVGGAEEQVGVGRAEHLDDVVGRDLLAAEGDELVERAEGVAEAPARRAGGQGDGAVLDLDPLGCRRRA